MERRIQPGLRIDGLRLIRLGAVFSQRMEQRLARDDGYDLQRLFSQFEEVMRPVDTAGI